MFIDFVRVKIAEFKDKFLCEVLRLPVFLWCLSLPQGNTTESVANSLRAGSPRD